MGSRFMLSCTAALLVVVASILLLLIPAEASPDTTSKPEIESVATQGIVKSPKEFRSAPPSNQVPTLSIQLGTGQTAYLAGETIVITIGTNLSNTKVRLLAQYDDGEQQEVSKFTFSGSRAIDWNPTKLGRIQITAEGQAEVQVKEWTTCYGVSYAGKQAYIYSYPCEQVVTKTVKDTATRSLKIYPRQTSISGRIVDNLKQPVAGASIYLSSTKQSTTTDRDGYYKFRTYELGNNYAVITDIPTFKETISIEAVACNRFSDSIQVPAGEGLSSADFTLHRCFWPAAIEPADFTASAFSGWSEANNVQTWKNILGITVDGPVEISKVRFEGRELPPGSLKSFPMGSKKLYLVTKPETGRYFLELESIQGGEYQVSTAATLADVPLAQSNMVNGSLKAKQSRLLRILLSENQIVLEHSKGIPLVLIIVPTIFGIIGGVAAAFLLTGGQVGDLRKALARIKLPQFKKAEPVAELPQKLTPAIKAAGKRSTEKGRTTTTTITRSKSDKAKTQIASQTTGETKVKSTTPVAKKVSAKTTKVKSTKSSTKTRGKTS